MWRALADVIVLSNVLEHISTVSFLKSLVSEVRPQKVLIRVPYFKREWSVAFRRAQHDVFQRPNSLYRT